MNYLFNFIFEELLVKNSYLNLNSWSLLVTQLSLKISIFEELLVKQFSLKF
jgi:hypothetical protein